MCYELTRLEKATVDERNDVLSRQIENCAHDIMNLKKHGINTREYEYYRMTADT